MNTIVSITIEPSEYKHKQMVIVYYVCCFHIISQSKYKIKMLSKYIGLLAWSSGSSRGHETERSRVRGLLESAS